MATRALLYLLLVSLLLQVGHGGPNYMDALSKSILFFQGQRSGKLPPDQKIVWRSDSGLSDGAAANVDLVGGYYDAGDNVKFGFPMAFTTTMLSWGVLEYGGKMGSNLESARSAVRWAADYLMKAATSTPGKLYVGVGDPNADHRCWERPEDMDTPRSVYSVSPQNPGSDVAAETAAALAAASMVFRQKDRLYSAALLTTAKKLMDFADKFRGAYSDSLGSAVCPFYCSYSGYKDELLWGASWLLRATSNASYLAYLNSLGANDYTDIFSWDNKFAGARVLLSRFFLLDKKQDYKQFSLMAESFMCSIIPNSPSSTTQYTPGGLMYKLSGSNLQYVTSISFLLITYCKYMAVSKHTFKCGNVLVTANVLQKLAKRQVDYILGSNPQGISYMVGYGGKFPKKIHHRGSSLPSQASHPQHIACQEGFSSLYSSGPNPNILTGAVVGGPDRNDHYSDDRNDYSQSEPATYINAAMVGSLGYFV